MQSRLEENRDAIDLEDVNLKRKNVKLSNASVCPDVLILISTLDGYQPSSHRLAENSLSKHCSGAWTCSFAATVANGEAVTV